MILVCNWWCRLCFLFCVVGWFLQSSIVLECIFQSRLVQIVWLLGLLKFLLPHWIFLMGFCQILHSFFIFKVLRICMILISVMKFSSFEFRTFSPLKAFWSVLHVFLFYLGSNLQRILGYLPSWCTWQFSNWLYAIEEDFCKISDKP